MRSDGIALRIGWFFQIDHDWRFLPGSEWRFPPDANTCCRVDQDTVPEDLYIYEVSHDENIRGKPVQISEWIRVNHWGTLLTSKPIRLDKYPRTFKTYREIDLEADWKKEKQKCHEQYDI